MTTETKTWMDLNTASAYANLSSSFLRRMVSERRITYTRSSTETSKLLFRSDWVDAFLEMNANKPGEES